MKYVELVEQTVASYDTAFDPKMFKNLNTEINGYVWVAQDGKLVVAKYDDKKEHFNSVYKSKYDLNKSPNSEEVKTIIKEIGTKG